MAASLSRAHDRTPVGCEAQDAVGEEVAQQYASTVLFPATFISNVFVPLQTLPDWLQPIAEWNPVSTLTASLRELWGNPNPFKGTALASTEPVLVTLVWVAVIVAIFAPLGVRRYRNMSR